MVKIFPKGKVFYFSEFEKEEAEVTGSASKFLWEPCQVHDATIRDLFLIIKSEIDLFESLLGDWCREYLEEAFKEDSDLNLVSDFVSACYYWEMYTFDEDNKKVLSGINIPKVVLKNSKGVNHYMSSIPVSKILDAKIKLGYAEIYDEVAHIKSLGHDIEGYIKLYNSCEFTLGDLLKGLTTSISTIGSPQDRLELKKKITERMMKIESGEEKTIPSDEVFDSLKYSVHNYSGNSSDDS